jgi:NADH-quinone oxidoreductase subunit N
MWTPDVYQGAPTPVAALFSVGPKAVGFAFLLRVFVLSFQEKSCLMIVVIVAILTMTVGNIMAVLQTNIKRLLAYSTIAQAGYILAGIVAAGMPGNVDILPGIKAMMFYIFVYSLMNLGVFGAVIMISNALNSETIEHYSGLYKKDPLSAVVLAISLLSLAGIPPLAGFLAKFFILSAAIEANFIILAVFIVINSIIAFYYYVRFIKFMFLEESKEPYLFQKTPAVALGLIFITVANILFGLWPHPVLQWLQSLVG